MKGAPEIYGFANQRKNRRTKRNKRRNVLVAQAETAWLAARDRFPDHVVLGLALWHDDAWVVIGELGPRRWLGACA